MPGGPVAVNRDAAHHGAREQGEIVPAERGFEMRHRGAAAAPVPFRRIEPRDPFGLVAVEVIGRALAGLGARLQEGIEERVLETAPRDAERPLAAAPVVGAPVAGLRRL